MKTTAEQSKDGCNENDATDATCALRSSDSRRFLQLGSSQRVQAQTHTGQTSVEQLRWKGYWNSRSDRRGPFWPVGQLPATQAATLGGKKKNHTILHPFMQPLPYVQLCLVRKPCQHLKKKKKKMGENWTHEKMLHQTLVSLALVISTAIADPIC